MSENAGGTTSKQLTLFAGDFLASRTVLPGSEGARQMTVTSGRNIAGLLPNSGPVGSLLRTCLVSERLSSTACYLTWKVWTTPQGRLLYRLAPSTPRTEGKGFSLWPTPTDASKGGGSSRSGSRINETPTLQGMARKGMLSRTWPTPNSRDWRSARRVESDTSYNQLNNEVWKAEGRQSGQLNPTWVEWLQGFPLDWTEVD